jgi:biotin carboxyl carrier protein
MRSGGPGLVRRLLVRITPQFAEDWAGFVGELFRGGVQKIDAYNRHHARIGEKVDEAPDMLWRAADGVTSIKHAQAQAAYSQAENGRIDAELKKRTLEARTRHEEAGAERAEAEAGIARVREIQARIELVQQLNAIGVKATLDPKALGAMHLHIEPLPNAPALQSGDLLDEDEETIMQADVTDIVAPEFGEHVPTMTLTRWMCSVGSRVEHDQPIYEVSTDIVDSEIPSPADGVILELLVEPGATFASGTVVGKMLSNPYLDIEG